MYFIVHTDKFSVKLSRRSSFLCVLSWRHGPQTSVKREVEACMFLSHLFNNKDQHTSQGKRIPFSPGIEPRTFQSVLSLLPCHLSHHTSADFRVFRSSFIRLGCRIIFATKVSNKNLTSKPENSKICAKNAYCVLGLSAILSLPIGSIVLEQFSKRSWFHTRSYRL